MRSTLVASLCLLSIGSSLSAALALNAEHAQVHLGLVSSNDGDASKESQAMRAHQLWRLDMRDLVEAERVKVRGLLMVSAMG